MTPDASTPRKHAVPGPMRERSHRFGEEALHFTRWFAQSKYHLMRAFTEEISRAPDEFDGTRLRDRYDRALDHGQRIHRVRAVVTLFLAAGAISTAASAIGDALGFGDTPGLLERVAAYAGSATVGLIVLRLLLDRYLERVDVVATFIAIQLSASAPRPSSAPRAR